MAESIQHPWSEVRRLQRAMVRSRRVNNPQNYDEKGSIKKGQKLVWYKSNNYLKLQKEYQEIERKLTATRLTSHGQLANIIRSLGDKILWLMAEFGYTLQKSKKQIAFNNPEETIREFTNEKRKQMAEVLISGLNKKELGEGNEATLS